MWSKCPQIASVQHTGRSDLHLETEPYASQEVQSLGKRDSLRNPVSLEASNILENFPHRISILAK